MAPVGVRDRDTSPPLATTARSGSGGALPPPPPPPPPARAAARACASAAARAATAPAGVGEPAGDGTRSGALRADVSGKPGELDAGEEAAEGGRGGGGTTAPRRTPRGVVVANVEDGSGRAGLGSGRSGGGHKK